jgi:hypothetical protein
MADNTQEQSNARSLNELNKSTLALQKEINAAKVEQLALLKKSKSITEAESKAYAKDLKDIGTKIVNLTKQRTIELGLIKEQREELKAQITQYSNIESSIGSISSAMGGLKDDLRNATKLGLDFGTSISNSTEAQRDKYKSASEAGANAISAITSLSQLSKEDAAQIAEYTQEYESQFAVMAKQLEELEAMKEDGRTKQGKAAKQAQQELRAQMGYLDEAFQKASKFSNMQKDVKELYEEMNEELETGNKFFQKLINYGKVFFSSFKGAVTVIGFAVGYIADEFGKINAQIGGGVSQLTGFKSQLTAISLIFGEEAVGAVTEFGARIGNVNKISNDLAFDLSLLPSHLGVSGDEAGKLVNQFGNLQGLSNKVALNTLESTSQLSAANGVIPSQVMKDLAQNTELAATYATGFGDNITKAAIDAARLGVDLSTVEKISNGLLDYQTSVANEMEASVLLGRNLNLQKARELAYADDIDGAMRAALEAAGGINEFNKMDVFQKRAVAAAIGVSVGELKQMTANMEEAKKPVGFLNASFSKMSGVVDSIGTQGLGKWLGILPGIFSLLGNIGFAFNTFGTSLPQIWTGLKKWVTGLFAVKAAQDSVNASTAASSMAGGAGGLTKAGKPDMRYAANKSIAPKMDTSGVDKTSKSVGGAGNNASAMLKGAAALFIAAAAIWILGKALQEFTKIGANEIISLAGALVVVGLALAAFGAFAAPIMLGAVALGFASIALGMFGAALMIVGNGLSTISTPFAMITTNLSTLASLDVTPIYSMAKALTALSASLGLVAGTGGLALPILNGLNGLGLISSPVATGLANTEINATGKAGPDIDGLIQEVKNLTNAILGEELIVQIDSREIARGMRKYLRNSAPV